MERSRSEIKSSEQLKPEQVPWQNKVFAYKCKSKKYPDFLKETGYGTPAGIKGVNCTHDFYPFWEGISVIPEDIKERPPVTVNGKTYDSYQATQKQRSMERDIRATKREIEAQKAIGGDTTQLNSNLRRKQADYRSFSEKADLKVKANRTRVVGGSSDLSKTRVMKSIQNDYTGYCASIPKSWNKTINSKNIALSGANPNFVANPRYYDKNDRHYNTNCVNSTIAYEMRRRGYSVIAGPANSVLRNNPMEAWENAKRIDVRNDAMSEIKNKLLEYGEGSRVCVCIPGNNNIKGHAIVAEFNGKNVEYLDVQTGGVYDISNKKVDGIWFFRIDNLDISQKGTNAVRKGK